MGEPRRYRTGVYGLVRVRCGCGHFDWVPVKPDQVVTVDGVYEKCVTCQDHDSNPEESLRP